MDKDDVYSKLEDELLKQRVIFVEGDFDEDNINILKRELMYCMTHKPKEPVTLYISSFGGELYDFLTIYGLLKKRKFKLTTIALGKCMSAGSYLLMLGDERLAMPEATIMFHELSYEVEYSKLHDQEIELVESKRLQKILNELVEKNSKIPNINEYMEKDKYLSPDDAYKLGVLTKKTK